MDCTILPYELYNPHNPLGVSDPWVYQCNVPNHNMCDLTKHKPSNVARTVKKHPNPSRHSLMIELGIAGVRGQHANH